MTKQKSAKPTALSPRWTSGPGSSVERLMVRLRVELGLQCQEGSFFRERHYSRDMAEGAAWWMKLKPERSTTLSPSVCSMFSVTTLLKAKRLSMLRHAFQIEIVPEE